MMHRTRALFSILSIALLCIAASPLTSFVSGAESVVLARGSENVATPSSSPNTLVVLCHAEQETAKQTYATFLKQIEDRGHRLTYTIAGDEPSLRLQKYGAFFYDNVILLCSLDEDLGEAFSVASIQSFVDSGRSLLIVGGEKVSEALREIVGEFGIDIDEDSTRVKDLVAFDKSASVTHDIVFGRVTKKASRIVGRTTRPILYRGIGHVAAASESLIPVLVGSPTSFSSSSSDVSLSEMGTTGGELNLISAIQTPNNARIVYSGSADLFSNEFLTRTGADASGNTEFVRNLAAWCFHERGLLRARNMLHYKIGAEHDRSPASYRVSDDLHYEVVIEEYDGASNAWKAYVSDDIQLEFTMLDPYIRMPLTHVSNGRYVAEFRAPDVYGVYKFVVPYRRYGVSNLHLSHTVSVHPFRHDEYERFILQAYPYYASTFALMGAFLVFGVLFLYQKD